MQTSGEGGKRAVFVVDPVPDKKASSDKSVFDAILVLLQSLDKSFTNSDNVVIDGPGEYEIGGVKLSATRNEADLIYNLNIDGMGIILGKLGTLEKFQNKLKEQSIVIAYVDSVINPAFITSLTSNVVIFYGEHAKELTLSFGKEAVKNLQKYSTTLDKLPLEIETIILE